mmetsp:Transcript_51803/g.123274  ORF Transcript_51803/g.123274 Transcript_51803/m.123274 type:complete len:196 (+) Transcript_51803:771-1358(+)
MAEPSKSSPCSGRYGSICSGRIIRIQARYWAYPSGFLALDAGRRQPFSSSDGQWQLEAKLGSLSPTLRFTASGCRSSSVKGPGDANPLALNAQPRFRATTTPTLGPGTLPADTDKNGTSREDSDKPLVSRQRRRESLASRSLVLRLALKVAALKLRGRFLVTLCVRVSLVPSATGTCDISHAITQHHKGRYHLTW